ncbi:porin family protein [Sphingobacterium sp. MYb382]|uniref:porin family protein n=1 Tax=Sphingobacterium sp. MYb382 TaxID=2745278 RepID=UPI0030954D5C
MRKILLTVTVALMTVAGAHAQTQTSWGLKGGVNLAKYTKLQEAKNNTGFYVTGFADFALSPQFSIQPGLSLQGKGAKSDFKDADDNFKNTINVMSIEVPVNAVYYIPAGTGNVFIGAGPYIGFNVSGKVKTKGQEGGISIDEKNNIKFSGDEKDMNRIDAGANFLLGYKLENGLLINGGYNLGLTNLVPHATDKVSNRVLSFGIGFQF